MEESTLPPTYDYSMSTECNHSTDVFQYVGKYADVRKELDYSYHRHYTPERQLLHDEWMDQFMQTIIRDGNRTCEAPTQNWIVFTAGPMGAGKSRTMQWLASQDLFPLDAYVKVDPDSLREILPETKELIRRNPSTAGYLTQKEVGYICEVLIMNSLNKGKNVLVDGTLRDHVWYAQYFKNLRDRFPNLKIAIIQVKASEATVLDRARRRAESTGRTVPETVLLDTIRILPEAMRILMPLTDFAATFENENDSTPLLVEMHAPNEGVHLHNDILELSAEVNGRSISREVTCQGVGSQETESQEVTCTTGLSKKTRCPVLSRRLSNPQSMEAVVAALDIFRDNWLMTCPVL